MAHADRVGASEWVKEYSFSPMYDAKRCRLTMTLLGSVVAGVTPEAAELLEKEQAEAWAGAATDLLYAAKLQ
eukprot:3901084-Pyramimonas_sp.AAC.1